MACVARLTPKRQEFEEAFPALSSSVLLLHVNTTIKQQQNTTTTHKNIKTNTQGTTPTSGLRS
jgi:hypothetical protein